CARDFVGTAITAGQGFDYW
nr:immunoglobulin heavy chain junction region [Macaca mulatta]